MIARAAVGIDRFVRRTPLTRFAGEPDGWKAIWLKDETEQLTGAFKIRGNLAKQSTLPPGSALVTASTGNHGVGAATAACMFGHSLRVYIPSSTPEVKRRCLRAAGAEIVEIDGDYNACEREARKAVAHEKLMFISSFDDFDIIDGHRGLCREVDDDLSRFETAFVPVGGGGLLSACLLEWHGRANVIGVELDSAPAMTHSLAAGRRVQLAAARGSAEGLLVREVGRIPFDICKSRGVSMALVSEKQIAAAIRSLWVDNGIRAEGAGAAALAAALAAPQSGATCVCIVSGGNIDDERLAAALATSEASSPRAAAGRAR